MRIFSLLLAFATLALSVYKWRYSILNLLMAIKTVRKTLVGLSFKIPSLRKRVIKTITDQ